ncbi:MAG: ABC transporter permease subunit [Deltaproteobacteria bacterium]|nr:ABC transporter permease subunit [Deltaproteobacteria bacterium]
MNFYPIFKKELRSYFTSLIAYVILAVFLVLAGYYFYTDLALFVLWGGASVQEGLWQYLFHDIRLILLFTIPLLTMRLFSEEKKLGTIELLFTYPFKDIEILLGKYLACLTVFSIMLGFTVLYPILLAIVYQVELGPLIASYLGMFLLGSAFISCGIMVSSLTENQIVAALVTSGIILTFWFIDWNEAAVSPSVAVVLHHLSFFEHFYNFVRGVIDTKDIIYFMLFIFFFLFLTLRSLESRRWRGLR